MIRSRLVRNHHIFFFETSVPSLTDSWPLVSSDVSGSFTAPSSGTLVKGASEFVYIPNPGFCGTDLFEYTLLSGNESDTARVEIDVICDSTIEGNEPAANRSPEEIAEIVALQDMNSTLDSETLMHEDDFVEGNMNEALSIPVLANDRVQGSESSYARDASSFLQ